MRIIIMKDYKRDYHPPPPPPIQIITELLRPLLLGLEMYCVGVGNYFFRNIKEMKNIASLPLRHHTLRTNYESLLNTADIMLHKLTSGKKWYMVYGICIWYMVYGICI